VRKGIATLIATALFGGLLGARPLVIYTEISPPDQFLGPDGQLTGFGTEVVRGLQKRVGNTDPIEVVPWIRGYKEIQEQPNVVLFSMARSKEREPLFGWVGPIRETSYSFYALADSKIVVKSLEEARNLNLIGVYKEDARDQYLTKKGFTNLDRSINNLTTVKKLMAGRIDCMVGTPDIGEEIRAAGLKPEDVREVFQFLKVQLYIAFSKATPALTLKAWTGALQAMKEDGSFKRIFQKYFPDSPLPEPAPKPD
jgi:polar amino acid transport system substrate-binding protein